MKAKATEPTIQEVHIYLEANKNNRRMRELRIEAAINDRPVLHIHRAVTYSWGVDDVLIAVRECLMKLHEETAYETE